MESKEAPRVLKAHVSLLVKNVEESAEFYRKMLGLDPVKVRPGYTKFDVENPPLNLSLNAGRLLRKGSLSHLGLQVANTDDVVAIRNRWAAAGLTVRDEMQTSCCYALQDKAWVEDPDGNEWEVFTVLADLQTSGAACCQPEGCCEMPITIETK
jgi:catechol 2,3-dioxygenase-like lactoylglutathione lyase family enzyme